MSNFSVRGQLVFCGMLLVLCAGGFVTLFWKQDSSETRIMNNMRSRVELVTHSTTYSQTITCNGQTVTITETCGDGEDPGVCWARFRAAVIAAQQGLGCR